MGWVVNATLRPFYPRERDPVPIVKKARWASEKTIKGKGKFGLKFGKNKFLLIMFLGTFPSRKMLRKYVPDFRFILC